MRRLRILLIATVCASMLATVAASPALAAVPTPQATVVQRIDTSAFSPPSPDPSGLAYFKGRLWMSDGEVDETPHWAGKNVFRITPQGALMSSFRTTKYSDEPAGIEVTKKKLYIADDVKDRIFVVGKGRDHLYGTRDDKVRSFGTDRLGCRDPEGIALGHGFLFISSGSDGGRGVVCRLSPGRNHRFDGVGKRGDDRVFRFLTGGLGQPDPEGIEYRPTRKGRILIVSNKQGSPISEVTLKGRLVRQILTQGLGLRSPAGLAWAPASDGAGFHIYVADRGIDNMADPGENDGSIVELSF